jgi:aspartyl-tRNA(Asn)/glutamyl-tRNA(Gln) amidotransferase subunit C
MTRPVHACVTMHSGMAEAKIGLEGVRHVARLARLDLEAEEEAKLQHDLSAILEYIEKLNELDLTGVEPTAQVGEAGTPMRDDVVTNEPAPEAVLANAPAREGFWFKVPKIIE